MLVPAHLTFPRPVIIIVDLVNTKIRVVLQPLDERRKEYVNLCLSALEMKRGGAIVR
jgi:hypothetical protein